MARFTQTKQHKTIWRTLLPIAVFVIIVCIFLGSLLTVSDSTVARQKESLENALSRTITYCYIVEGTYPQSLDYIKDSYGLTYNDELFYVDYKPNGANIYPDVTIIQNRED